jgi:2Fe-2S ferredoxin
LEQEKALLTEVAAERRQTSRLSCQIQMTSGLDGLLLHIPNKQI